MTTDVSMTHTQAVHRLKDIQDELTRLKAKSENGGLTPEDETYWDELFSESGDLDEHRKRLEREAEAERVKIRVEAASSRSGLKIERGSDKGELDRDILDVRIGGDGGVLHVRNDERGVPGEDVDDVGAASG